MESNCTVSNETKSASTFQSLKRRTPSEAETKTICGTDRLAARQEEPFELLKEQFVPKAVALACSLFPQVKQEFRNKQQQEVEEDENDAIIPKTTGLDEDVEDGLYSEDLKVSSPNNCTIDYEKECLHLPPSAAKALTSLLRSSRSMRYQRDRRDESLNYASERDDEDDDDSVLLGSKELFGLKSDLDSRDKEGDAILDSIRNDSLTPPSECVPFWANNDQDSVCHDSDFNGGKNQEERNDEIMSLANVGEDDVSLATADDDDLNRELNSLGNVISSLRNDLSVVEISHRRLEDIVQTERIRDFVSNDTIELAAGLKTWRALGRALAPQDNSEGQHGRRAFDYASSLYWAIALIWAIAILLAGHVKFSGDLKTLPGFLDILLKV